MHLRRRLLKNCYLYAITKANVVKARRIVEGKVDILQLRDKSVADGRLLRAAKKIACFCRKRKVLFIINDRVDIAVASKADGVHLGQDDMSVYDARKIVPRNFLIGISTHSLKQALTAQEQGADYIGFGPIFATRTKPHLRPIGTKEITALSKKIKIPYFVIGNVNLKNIKSLKKQGVKRIAVQNAIYKSRAPRERIAAFKKQLALNFALGPD